MPYLEKANIFITNRLLVQRTRSFSFNRCTTLKENIYGNWNFSSQAINKLNFIISPYQPIFAYILREKNIGENHKKA